MTTYSALVTLFGLATTEHSRRPQRQQLGNRQEMAELAKQIIRQQWGKRHHPDANVRSQAVTLIKAHIVMLRKWQNLRS